MTPVAPGAVQPRLAEDVVERIDAHAKDLFSRLNGGEDFERVASSVAERAGVTPGQVALFVDAVIRAHSMS